jgi:hypothetical protein
MKLSGERGAVNIDGRAGKNRVQECIVLLWQI